MVGGLHGNRDVGYFAVYLLLGVGQRLIAVDDGTVDLIRLEICRAVLPDEPSEPLSHIKQPELCP